MSTLYSETTASMTLSKNIRELRTNRGLSQVELAALVGMSHPRISDIERNHGNPTLGTITKLAEFFGVSEADLLSEKKLSQSS